MIIVDHTLSLISIDDILFIRYNDLFLVQQQFEKIFLTRTYHKRVQNNECSKYNYLTDVTVCGLQNKVTDNTVAFETK